jgi:uncharacterized protein
MGEASAWAPHGDGVRLVVRLTPNARREAIEGLETLADGRVVLKVRVRAIPEDNKANMALRRLLADALDAPVSRIDIVAGATARLKTLAIAGDPVSLAAKLDALAGSL